MHSEAPILSIRRLCKQFPMGKRQLYAVRDVSLSLGRGECLGIVGESGCGKSTLAKMVIGSLAPSCGEIRLDGVDIWSLRGRQRRMFRRRIQMVFQDPASSFSPRMTIGEYLSEPRRNYDRLSKKASLAESELLLERVGLPPSFLRRLPHQLSGGQLQRVAIARAIAISPDLLVCDEATGALDVSIQNQIVQLLVRLQQERQIASLFIGHDLALVRSVSRRIAVMYLGRVVEVLESETLAERAAHPYTLALLSAVFDVYGDPQKEIRLLQGDPPSPLELHKGCPFVSRCDRKAGCCFESAPALCAIAPDHLVACHMTHV